MIHTRLHTVDVHGRLPAGAAAAAGASATLRLYVDGKLQRTQRLPRGTRFLFRGVELPADSSAVTVGLRTVAGATLRSAPLTVVIDREPPEISITEPAAGEVVHAVSVALGGNTQPGSTVEATNRTTGAKAKVAAPEGRFSLSLALREGPNAIVMRSVDPAGNRAETTLTIERGKPKPPATLHVFPSVLLLRSLPRAVSMRVEVVGRDGAPLEGVRVVFSFSPPGLPTSTYEAETRTDGTAVWPSVNVPREGVATGKGFATARVELPDGSSARDNVPFEIR